MQGFGDCAGRAGAVGAIVLSFTEARTLLPNATTSIGRLTVEGAAMPGLVPRVRNVDGCRGSGQPVQNAMTVEGATERACNFGTASVTVIFRGIEVIHSQSPQNHDSSIDSSPALS